MCVGSLSSFAQNAEPALKNQAQGARFGSTAVSCRASGGPVRRASSHCGYCPSQRQCFEGRNAWGQSDALAVAEAAVKNWKYAPGPAQTGEEVLFDFNTGSH